MADDTSGDGSGHDESPSGNEGVDEAPRTQPEGVRIIGATEAVAAVRTASVADDELPRFQPADGSSPSEFSSTHHVIPVQEVSEIPAVEPEQSFEMPHYSEPPTGQVPKVVIGEETDARWSGLADQPRWRDTEHQFDEQGGFEDLADEGPRLGALAPTGEHRAAFVDLELTDDNVPTLGAGSGAGAGDGAAVEPEAGASRADRTSGAGAPSGSVPVVEVDPEAEPAVRRPPTPRRRREHIEGDGSGRAPAAAAPAGGRNVPVAAAVGIGLLSLGGICFYAGAVATTLLVGVVLCMCAAEMFTALKTAGYRPATLVGMAAVGGLAIAPLYEGYFAYPVVLGLTTIIGLAWYLFVQPGEGAVMNLGVTLLSVMWIGGLGSFASLAIGRARLVETASTSNQGIGIVLAAVVVAVSYDVGAFFVGRALGRTPLNEASPNKTQEGLLGGIAAAIFVPFLILFLGEWHPVYGNAKTIIAFCLICAVMAPIGDLCESAIKRDLKIKDMGSILPGHGGVLDRFDGLLFVLPTAFFMAHLLQLGSPKIF